MVDRVHEIGLKTELSRGEERTLVGVIGGNAYAYKEAFSHLERHPRDHPDHQALQAGEPRVPAGSTRWSTWAA